MTALKRTGLHFLLCCTAAIVFSTNAGAQDQIGIAQSNNHVTEGNRINPSFGVDAKPWLDLHFGGAYGYFTDNYAYLSTEHINLYRLRFTRKFSVNEENNDKYLNSEGRVEGPGFSMVLGRSYLGFGSSIRYMAMARNVPFEMAQNYWFEWREDSHVGNQYNFDAFRIKQMSWAEFTFNGGTILSAKGNNVWTGGIALKYLRGFNQGSFLTDNFNYGVPDPNTFNVSSYNGTYTATPFTTNSGNGAAMDLGVTYKRALKTVDYFVPHSTDANCKKIDYLYRIGLSMIDLGFLRYRAGGETVFRTVENGSAVWPRMGDRIRIDNYGILSQDLDAHFAGDASEADNAVTAWLPMAFSFQFDYNLQHNRKGTKQIPNWFLNVSAMAAVPRPGKAGTERASWVAVTPRYETRRFDIAFPVSMTSKMVPHIGIGVRYWSVSAGITNLIPIIGAMDNYHFGAYFHLKHAIFTSPQCRRGYRPDEPEWRMKDCTNPKLRFPKQGRKQRKKMKKRQKKYLD